MKQFYISFLIFIISAINSFAQIVNIPDTNFKAALVGNSLINTNGDAEIQMSEAGAFTGSVNVWGRNIQDLTGIEAFVAIERLDCSANDLTTLNVSSNTVLKTLICTGNQISALNLSDNTQLISVSCGYNLLSALNLNNINDLQILQCNNNQLTNIDLSGKRFLEYLNCKSNQLTAINLNGDTALTNLQCSNNLLTALDVSTLISLDYIEVDFNQLSNLDLSNNPILTFINCHNNSITDLNVTGLNVLDFIDCSENQLSNLDISTNTELSILNTSFNQLTELDANQNSSLTYFQAVYNQLTYLNFKNGNNLNVNYFHAGFNINLLCVEVDNPAYSDTAANWYKDFAATYNSNCISTIVNEDVSPLISLYPNPSNGTFTIELKNESANSSVEITNHLGKKIFSGMFNGSSMNFDQIFETGIYFVRISGGRRVRVEHLVVI